MRYVPVFLMFVIAIGCKMTNHETACDESGYAFRIKKIDDNFKLTADPTEGAWPLAGSLEIENFSWLKPEDPLPPETAVRLLYSNDRIYVLFHAKEKWLQARETRFNHNVCFDSCVEFFVAPNEKGYFNFEFNCVGTLLVWFGPSRKERVALTMEDVRDVEIVTSLPKGIAIDEAIPGPPDGYTVAVSIPFEIFEKYSGVTRPVSGTVWRANFYKCSDRTPQPAWGTWAPVDLPKPDFHRPEFFGRIIFE